MTEKTPPRSDSDVLVRAGTSGTANMGWARGVIALSVLSVAASLPLPVSAQGQASPFVGTWHLNAALSKAAPGETLPRDLTTEISRVEPAHVHWSTTTVNAKGEKDVRVFDNPGNGEFYSFSPYVMVSHTIGPNSLQSVYRDNTGQNDVLTCTLSAAGRQMSCAGLVTHKDGSVVRYTDVFERL